MQYKKGKKPIEYFYKSYDPNCDYSKSDLIKFQGCYVEPLNYEWHLQYKPDFSPRYLVYKFLPNGRIYTIGSHFGNYPTNDSLKTKIRGNLKIYKLKDNNIEIESLGNNVLWSITNFISYGEIKGDSIFIHDYSYYDGSKRTPNKRLLVYDSTLTAKYP